MNEDIIQGKWNQIKGEAQKRWGKITQDGFDQVNGNRTKLLGLIQESYGVAKDDAESKFLQRLFKELDLRGMLDVIRHGITDSGIKFKLAFFKRIESRQTVFELLKNPLGPVLNRVKPFCFSFVDHIAAAVVHAFSPVGL